MCVKAQQTRKILYIYIYTQTETIFGLFGKGCHFNVYTNWNCRFRLCVKLLIATVRVCQSAKYKFKKALTTNDKNKQITFYVFQDINYIIAIIVMIFLKWWNSLNVLRISKLFKNVWLQSTFFVMHFNSVALFIFLEQKWAATDAPLHLTLLHESLISFLWAVQNVGNHMALNLF